MPPSSWPDEAPRRVAYGATWPEGHAGRLVSLARPRSPGGPLGIEPDAFGAPANSITTSLDVRPFLPAKLAALREYASQIGPSHLLSALPGDLAEEFLGREYFVVLSSALPPGPDWLGTALAQP